MELKHSINARFVALVKKGLECRDINPKPLFTRYNIGSLINLQPHDRFPQETADMLLNESAELLNDDAFSVSLADISIFTTNQFSLLAASQDSAEKIFKLASQRYGETFTTVIHTTLKESNDISLIFNKVETYDGNPKYTIDFMVSYIVHFFSSIYDHPTALPTAVMLRRETPNNVATFENRFRCPVQFGAEQNELHYSKEIYKLRNPLYNRNISNMLEVMLNDELKEFDQIPISVKTSYYIANQLPDILPTQKAWAENLKISVRSLQRQLNAENTSFLEVLKRERIKLAVGYLADKKLTVTEIAALLHFSDSSHFIRVFKQTTGETPAVYQKSKL